MLRKTKNFLRSQNIAYHKEHVNPLMVPEKVYVLKFGKDRDNLNNRFIVEHTYTWTGRIKITKIIVRLHGQKHPHVFANESQLLRYLKKKAYRFTDEEKPKKKKKSKKKSVDTKDEKAETVKAEEAATPKNNK